jgi:hypothetical protein
MNYVNNAVGTIAYAAVVESTPVTGTFTLATIRLKAGLPLADRLVRFAFQPGRMTDVVYHELSVLGAASPAHVTVSGYAVRLPVVLSGF